MMSKILEEKIEVQPEQHLNSGLKNPISLEYYLVESDCGERDYPSMDIKKLYGIEVVKKVIPFERTVPMEVEMVRDFSCNRDNTRRVLSILASNAVTPVGLRCVLDDLLGA